MAKLEEIWQNLEKKTQHRLSFCSPIICVRKIKTCKHFERLVLSFHISGELISFLAKIFQEYCIFSQDLARALAKYFQELYFLSTYVIEPIQKLWLL